MTGTNLDVLLLGIDAACLPLLRRLQRTNSIPHLSSLLADGTSGPLESQLPPWTPSAWPSMYTGTNPGQHGVFSFLEYEGYDWNVVDSSAVAEPTLWEILDANGVSSVVVNVPVTHPPSDIDGAVVPGFVGPEDPTCSPRGLLSDIREELGDYRIYADNEFEGDAPREARVSEYRRLVRSRGEVFRYLADRFDPDFGFLQFQQTDTVFHDMPGDFDAVRSVYEAVDEQVGETLAATDPTYVLLASDHGIGEFDRYEFRVNEFLREKGYVKTTRDDAGMPSWVPLWRESLSGGDEDVPDGDEPERGGVGFAGVAERGLAAMSAIGVSPVRVADALDRVGLLSVAGRFVPASVASSAGVAERVDFAESTAYMRLPVELGIRLNVAGREPDGVVDPDEYESVRSELIDLLSDVTTPDGDPMFERVARREDVFDGPEVEKAVDIVTVPAGFENFPAAQLRGEVFGTPQEPWNHKLHGVVGVVGPDVPEGEASDAHLLDVAPTVLSLLDVPVCDRMKGSPLVGERPPERTYDRPDRGQHDAPGESVESHLANLGYLD